MIIRLLTLLVVFCCFFSYSNAQEYSDNLLNNNNWNGATYGYDPGGCCASISGSGALYDYGTNTILYSYGRDVLSQTIAINEALNASGIEVSGFNYGWSFKKVSNSGRDGDTLYFDIQLKDSSGNAVENYNYNYSSGSNYLHNQWYTINGTETFANSYIDPQSITLTITGKDGGFWAGYYGPEVKDVSLSLNYSSNSCASNPLSDPTCEGYAEAYYNQQCSFNPLYDQGCTGYEDAYYTQQCSMDSLYDVGCTGYEDAYYIQQCSMDSLYDVGCPGYAEAYYSYQCSLDALYDNGCSGYAEAFTEQQCELNPQYSPVCNGYEFPVVEITVTEPETVIEEPIQVVEQVQEVQIIEQPQEIAEEPTIIDESEEEIVELSVALEQNDEKTEKLEEKPKNNRRQAAIAGSLESTQQLLQQIIGSSMSSGTNESNLQGSTGDLYSDDTQNFSNLQNSSMDVQETLSQTSTAEQDSQNLNDSMALGPSLNLGISFSVNNEPKEEQKENKKQTLAERMAKMIQKKNLENQTGIFGGQESVLTDIANGANMNKYYEERLVDASKWYGTKDIYGGNRMTDSNKSFYRLNSENHGTMQQLIRSQY